MVLIGLFKYDTSINHVAVPCDEITAAIESNLSNLSSNSPILDIQRGMI